MKKILIGLLFLGTIFSSCKKTKDADAIPTVQLRPMIDASKATDTTTYTKLFVDEKGATTVSVTEGKTLLSFFQDSLSGYARKATTQEISAEGLKARYNYTNTEGKSLSMLTASSRTNAAESDAIRAKLESYFTLLAVASKSRDSVAAKGKAGILSASSTNACTGAISTSKYLVDAKGLEGTQLIAKGLIGSFQIDYIGNVLLGTGLDADNSTLVNGKNYTALEHNWDLAFSTLTKNTYYGKSAQLAPGVACATSGESQLGSYVWEYNQDAFKQLNKAFVKGRIAIVNNNKAELKAQADFIRNAFEKAIANAALGYLKKWKDGANDAVRAHAIGEGYGFIYSLRVATKNGGTDKFSDDILTALIGSEYGFWDLTVEKVNVAGTAIATKFGVARPW